MKKPSKPTARRLVYMDGTDFEVELGEINGGLSIYRSTKDILRSTTCARRCGVVEIELRPRRWAIKKGRPQRKRPKHIPRTAKQFLLYQIQTYTRHRDLLQGRVDYLGQQLESLRAKAVRMKRAAAKARKR